MAAATIESPVAGRVVQVVAAPGQSVSAGTALVLIECMKMEIPVEAQSAGTVAEIRVAQGDQVKEGQVVAVLR